MLFGAAPFTDNSTWVYKAGSVSLTPLTLLNGWTNAPFSTSDAEVETVNGIVHLKGAVRWGSSPELFVLPSADRPSHTVYVPVDLCNAANGRLIIEASGEVSVQAQGEFSDANCFTSLDGASFALNASGFTALNLINGWSGAAYSTAPPAVIEQGGIVHFEGAMSTSGTSMEPFVLPPAFWPKTAVYVPVDLCNATGGRLFIQPNGVMTVQAENGDTSNASCFTSLDGAWFVASDSGAQSLSLLNGWKGAPYGTSQPKVEESSGVVYFQGAISLGSNDEAFVLPPSLSPETNVYVPVDLCDATKGRLNVQPSGVVSVEAETSNTNATCFTSLDGASFALY
jgi:hypothetical protein